MSALASPSLAEIYLAKRDDLIRFLAARSGDRALAEDLVQELYLRLDRAAPGDGIDNPAAYLYRMAANLLLDHRRGAARTIRREADWVDANSHQLGGEAVDDGVAADARLDAKMRLARVKAAIDELPPQCRRVFTLHKLEGNSHAEVAATLGISRKAVEKHMTTALKHLVVLRTDAGNPGG